MLSGAGLSAESGVPTFRDAQNGLWAKYQPEELATPQAFRRNPALVWEWYAWRRELVSKAQPNPAHLALVQLEEKIIRLGKRFCHVTQNVDGLSQRAGGTAIIELHGNLHRYRCFEENTPIVNVQDSQEIPPRCPNCGGLLRPDVVWFGENLPHKALENAIQEARECDLFITVGTSLLVQPAASLPYIAQQNGATLVEINPVPTQLASSANYSILAPATQALPALVQAAWE
jgi:NAD-dependent deacetylase